MKYSLPQSKFSKSIPYALSGLKIGPSGRLWERATEVYERMGAETEISALNTALNNKPRSSSILKTFQSMVKNISSTIDKCPEKLFSAEKLVTTFNAGGWRPCVDCNYSPSDRNSFLSFNRA